METNQVVGGERDQLAEEVAVGVEGQEVGDLNWHRMTQFTW